MLQWLTTYGSMVEGRRRLALDRKLFQREFRHCLTDTPEKWVKLSQALRILDPDSSEASKFCRTIRTITSVFKPTIVFGLSELDNPLARLYPNNTCGKT
jgi:hypothetical protein